MKTARPAVISTTLASRIVRFMRGRCHVESLADGSGSIDLGSFPDLLADPAESGQEHERPEADVDPDRHPDQHEQRLTGALVEALRRDAEDTEHSVHGSGGGLEERPPQDHDDWRCDRQRNQQDQLIKAGTGADGAQASAVRMLSAMQMHRRKHGVDDGRPRWR